MDNQPHYEIRTIADIREKIPPERLDAFLADLKVWVMQEGFDIGKAYEALLVALSSDMMGAPVTIEKQGFDDVLFWVDDGVVGVSEIQTQCDGEVIQTLKIHRKKDGETVDE